MFNINRLFFGFFLAVLWPSSLMLCAEEPSPDAVFSENVVSSVSEAATPGIDSAVRMAQEEVRDPFALAPETGAVTIAPEAKAAPEIKVELQGIGFGSQDAYAVIGGDVFYKGDEKKGIKLLEVRRREVDIVVNGGKVTIPLFQGRDLQMARERAKKKGAMGNASVDQSSETSSSLSERERPPV